uniref:Uncharacterized protein n=1 Tax=Anguilla anguilla TaxID=7936 RepID=A0A0E9PDF8_ANGAN
MCFCLLHFPLSYITFCSKDFVNKCGIFELY